MKLLTSKGLMSFNVYNSAHHFRNQYLLMFLVLRQIIKTEIFKTK